MRGSRVSRPSALSDRPQSRVEFQQGAGDAVPHRVGLAVRPAAGDVDAHVEFFRRAGDRQRLGRLRPLGFEHEIIVKRAAVDGDFAVAGREADARDGGLAPAGAQKFVGFRF